MSGNDILFSGEIYVRQMRKWQTNGLCTVHACFPTWSFCQNLLQCVFPFQKSKSQKDHQSNSSDVSRALIPSKLSLRHGNAMFQQRNLNTTLKTFASVFNHRGSGHCRIPVSISNLAYIPYFTLYTFWAMILLERYCASRKVAATFHHRFHMHSSYNTLMCFGTTHSACKIFDWMIKKDWT